MIHSFTIVAYVNAVGRVHSKNGSFNCIQIKTLTLSLTNVETAAHDRVLQTQSRLLGH